MFHSCILLQVWLGFPILFFIICLFLVVLPIIQRPIELGVAIGVIIIGIPIYYFAIYREDKPKWFIRFTGECSIVYIKSSWTLISESDSALQEAEDFFIHFFFSLYSLFPFFFFFCLSSSLLFFLHFFFFYYFFIMERSSFFSFCLEN